MAVEERRSWKERIRTLFTGKKKTCGSPCPLDIDEQPQRHLDEVEKAQHEFGLQSIKAEAPSKFQPPKPVVLQTGVPEKKIMSPPMDPLKRTLSGLSPHWTPAALSPLERFYQEYIAPYDERRLDPPKPKSRNKSSKAKEKDRIRKDSTIDSVTSLNFEEEWMDISEKYEAPIVHEGSTQTENNFDPGYEWGFLCKKPTNLIGGQGWLAEAPYENVGTSMGVMMTDGEEKSVQVVESLEKLVTGSDDQIPSSNKETKKDTEKDTKKNANKDTNKDTNKDINNVFPFKGIDVNINLQKSKSRNVEDDLNSHTKFPHVVLESETMATTSTKETPGSEVACSTQTFEDGKKHSQIQLGFTEAPMTIRSENVYINLGGENPQIGSWPGNEFTLAGSVQIPKHAKGKTKSKTKSGKKISKHKQEGSKAKSSNEENMKDSEFEKRSKEGDGKNEMKNQHDAEAFLHVSFEEWLSTVDKGSKPIEARVYRKVSGTENLELVESLLEKNAFEECLGTEHVSPKSPGMAMSSCRSSYNPSGRLDYLILETKHDIETDHPNDVRITSEFDCLKGGENVECNPHTKAGFKENIGENIVISPIHTERDAHTTSEYFSVSGVQILDLNEHHPQMGHPGHDHGLDVGHDINSNVGHVIRGQSSLARDDERDTTMANLHEGNDLSQDGNIVTNLQAGNISLDIESRDNRDIRPVDGESQENQFQVHARGQGMDDQGMCDVQAWNRSGSSQERGSHDIFSATLSGTAECSVRHVTNDDPVVGPDLGCNHRSKECQEMSTMINQSSQTTPNESIDDTNEGLLTDTLISDETGLVDVYRLKKRVDGQNHHFNKCINKYRRRTEQMSRLLKYMDQLKADTKEMKRLLAGVDKETSTMRDEVTEMRCTVTAVCDLSVSTIEKETEAKKREPACYRRYLNIRSSTDAANALLAVRNRIKALNDLEVLIYRKQLVLHHVLPATVQEKTPVPKRANRPAVKCPKTKRTDQSTSGEATGNIVIEVVAPVADATTRSWSDEVSHTDSPLTISTTPLSGSNDEGSDPVQVHQLPDTEV